MRKLAAAALALAVVAPVPAAAESPHFTLINRAGRAIVALNLSPAAAERWSPDLLGAGPVANGRATLVSIPPAGAGCSFDLRFSYAGGEISELRSVDLCQARSITVSAGDDEDEATDIAAAPRAGFSSSGG